MHFVHLARYSHLFSRNPTAKVQKLAELDQIVYVSHTHQPLKLRVTLD